MNKEIWILAKIRDILLDIDDKWFFGIAAVSVIFTGVFIDEVYGILVLFFFAILMKIHDAYEITLSTILSGFFFILSVLGLLFFLSLIPFPIPIYMQPGL